MKPPKSHGTGIFSPDQFAKLGDGCCFEPGVLVFHPENIELGSNIYVGHQAILKGYHKNKLVIGSGSWIGQQVFMHAAGGIEIGERVGIGPGVKILTSEHNFGDHGPVMDAPLRFEPVRIGHGADIGVGAIILPGVTIDDGAVIGAGAVVTKSVRAYHIAAGVPAKHIGER